MTNPKELQAALDGKAMVQNIPAGLDAGDAAVFTLGAMKYGRFNWRASGIKASTYRGAMARHLDAWARGESVDPESGVSHLHHIRACCGLLIDAEAHGSLQNDLNDCEVLGGGKS